LVKRKRIYLFDWGDTLMVDFPNQIGKMCEWKRVAACEGAKEVLEALSQIASIYIATGAHDSSVADIKKAFERVHLAKYISGYFCKANLGLSKGTPEFLEAIISQLNVDKKLVTIVGDSYEKDILPALHVNIKSIWLTDQEEPSHKLIVKIPSLSDFSMSML
jgi:putative hydrolase of the HAD superfamily